MDYFNKKGSKIGLIGIAIVAVLAIGVGLLYVPSKSSEKEPVSPSSSPIDYNPCCDFPCQNKGFCINLANNSYYCDCTNTHYYGLNCDIPTWSEAIKKFVVPSLESIDNLITGYDCLWRFVNKFKTINNFIMKYVFLSRADAVGSPPQFNSDHTYTTLDVYFNRSYFARTLPPVPLDCPTPMGTKGPKELIDPHELFKRVFERRTFKPEPHDTNVLFLYYAQHFTHQFFRTDFSSKGGEMTLDNGGVDVSNIYGLTESRRRGLRSWVDGKLKTQIIEGEEFPPLMRDTENVPMAYPEAGAIPHLPEIPEDSKFALGHPFFALLPGLFAYATIWMREHNRVCDILKAEHPHWDDERLYQTARLIITGQNIKITIEDYVQHLSQYKVKLSFVPEVVHGTRFQFSNRIHAEFDHLYHWHALVPDGLNVNGTYYSIEEMLYSTEPIFKHGLDNFIDALTKARAGALTARNHPKVTGPIFERSVAFMRAMRFPGFNEYRKRFGMSPYKTFRELTGEDELSKELEDIYKDIDAVEFFVGLMAEEPGHSMTAFTVVNIGGPWAIKGLIANPICSPHWWKPSTFGGDVGFNIVKTATLEKLFCNNMKSTCKRISFTVPPGTP